MRACVGLNRHHITVARRFNGLTAWRKPYDVVPTANEPDGGGG
jgi:hypothetical protein